jgi:hypothetical protein
MGMQRTRFSIPIAVLSAAYPSLEEEPGSPARRPVGLPFLVHGEAESVTACDDARWHLIAAYALAARPALLGFAIAVPSRAASP